MNPCAGATDLLVFEARPFSHLGIPPYIWAGEVKYPRQTCQLLPYTLKIVFWVVVGGNFLFHFLKVIGCYQKYVIEF